MVSIMLARPRRSRLVALIGLALLLAPVAARAQSCAMPPRPSSLVPATVVRVVDGDTLVARLGDGRLTRVRLIGVDTPEVHDADKLRREAESAGRDTATIRALGVRATQFTKKHLVGRRIEIERDVTALDRYGRTLAYVWLGDELYNLVLVREGYAKLITLPPNVKYAGTLAACYRAARAGRRGLWAALD
jgi:endonuclease YncB( thermonuclease family)